MSEAGDVPARVADEVARAQRDHGRDYASEPHLVSEDAPGQCNHSVQSSPGVEREIDCDCEGFMVRARRGPGSYSMQGVEDVWLGVKGDATWSKDRARRDIPEIVFAPIGEHSSKPERVYDRIEALWPTATPRLELFARRRRPGWFAWGAEAPECDLVFGSQIGTTWPVKRPIRESLAALRDAIDPNGDHDLDAHEAYLKAAREGES